MKAKHNKVIKLNNLIKLLAQKKLTELNKDYKFYHCLKLLVSQRDHYQDLNSLFNFIPNN